MTMTLSMMRLIISVASPEGAFGHEAKLTEEALLSRQTNVAAATWIREDTTRRDCDDASGTHPEEGELSGFVARSLEWWS